MILTKKTFHISCAIDDSYVYPLAVLLTSLFENHKDANIKFHLCSASFSEYNTNKIRELVCTKYNQKFSFYPLDPKDFENFKFVDRFSMATYYRLLVADNIEKDVERFLHLDADMIVMNRIDELFELDLEDKIFGAVNDITAIDWNLQRKHQIPDDFLYFNSGALLIDRHKWVDFNVTAKTIQFLLANMDSYDYVDQDALNNSMYQYRYRIHPKFNQQIGMFFVDPVGLNIPFVEEYKFAVTNPIIIHYNGMEKPWYYYSGHPFQCAFEKYAELVQNFDPIKAKFSIRKWIKKIVIYRMLSWNYFNRYYYYKTKPNYNKKGIKND